MTTAKKPVRVITSRATVGATVSARRTIGSNHRQSGIGWLPGARSPTQPEKGAGQAPKTCLSQSLPPIGTPSWNGECFPEMRPLPHNSRQFPNGRPPFLNRGIPFGCTDHPWRPFFATCTSRRHPLPLILPLACSNLATSNPPRTQSPTPMLLALRLTPDGPTPGHTVPSVRDQPGPMARSCGKA